MIKRFVYPLILINLMFTTCVFGKEYILELGAGIALGELPHYPGADQTRSFIVPFPFVYYKDESLTIDRQAIRDKLFDNNNVSISITASGAIPVASDDNQARQGMTDLGWVGELGPSLDFQLTPYLQFSLQTRKAIAFSDKKISDIGWRADTKLSVSPPKSISLWKGELKLIAELKLAFANNRYHQYYYGVDIPNVTDERPFYDARSGITQMQFSTGLTWRKDNLWIGAYARMSDLTHAANTSSPLLLDKRQSSAGIAIAWIFKTSKGN